MERPFEPEVVAGLLTSAQAAEPQDKVNTKAASK
jgi:hypothetical protein